jgi:hypothetical protein
MVCGGMVSLCLGELSTGTFLRSVETLADSKLFQRSLAGVDDLVG